MFIFIWILTESKLEYSCTAERMDELTEQDSDMIK